MAEQGNNPANSSFIIVLSKEVKFPVKDTIEFQFMPDSISDSKSAIYNDVAIIARSSPLKNYSHSGARTISFTLQFFANPEAGEGGFTADKVKKKVDILRALVMPDYEGFIVRPPPRCIVNVGNQLTFLGVCKSVNVSYTNTSPWSILPDVYAHHATVSLSFEEMLNIPLSYAETKRGNASTEAEAQSIGVKTSLLGVTQDPQSPVESLITMDEFTSPLEPESYDPTDSLIDPSNIAPINIDQTPTSLVNEGSFSLGLTTQSSTPTPTSFGLGIK